MRLRKKLNLIKKQKRSFRKDLFKITSTLVFILILLFIALNFISCDSGWSVAGWEVK